MPRINTATNSKVVARLLRGLAIDVESNAVLADRILDVLTSNGIFPEIDQNASEESSFDQTLPSASLSKLIVLQADRIDVFAIFRFGSEEQLRQRLTAFDAAALRRIIQVQELDRDKQTARLRSVVKLTDFIVEAVAAKVAQEREVARNASWML